jgi:hypothetical protein
MGYWKERQIEEGEQGWHFVDDRWVCADCVTDETLKAVVRAQLVQRSSTRQTPPSRARNRDGRRDPGGGSHMIAPLAR